MIAPDPNRVRDANLEEIRDLRLPLPPPDFPLVWEAGDTVDLRPLPELENRAAVLNVVLARSFGMPSKLAVQWLLDAHLIEQLTRPEWQFVAVGEGDPQTFALHLEALYALAWLLGIAKVLDPVVPSGNLI